MEAGPLDRAWDRSRTSVRARVRRWESKRWQIGQCALAAGLAAFLFHKPINRLGKPVMVLDAAGLGLFTVAGCSKALSYGLTPLPAALLGVMTACGGGAMRDLLVAEVPRVLREEIYAMAALLGAAVVIAGRQLDLPPVPVAVVGALAAFLLRVVSVQRNWSAPKAPWS